MTLWQTKGNGVLDVVIEPEVALVATICASTLEQLEIFQEIAPMPPFEIEGGEFAFGIHVPTGATLPRGYAKILTRKSALPEVLDHRISPEPVGWFWAALADELTGYTGFYSNEYSGVVWDATFSSMVEAMRMAGYEDEVIVPIYNPKDAHYVSSAQADLFAAALARKQLNEQIAEIESAYNRPAGLCLLAGPDELFRSAEQLL